MGKIYFLLVAIHLFLYSFSQQVGIGTTSPTERLHVAGNIKGDTTKTNVVKITPNAGAGKILTSDADGNGSWQSNLLPANGGNVGYGAWGDCATNANISEFQPMSDSLGVGGDAGGTSVSISGDFAFVGAPDDDIAGNTDEGSVCVYRHNGTRWQFFLKLTDATGAAGDRFGAGVFVSGNYAVIGSPGDDISVLPNRGSASVYQFNGTTWVFMQRLLDNTGAVNDGFGNDVATNGTYILVGSSLDDVGSDVDRGSVSSFELEGGVWVYKQKITDPDGQAGDFFGNAVWVTSSGPSLES